MMKLVAQNAHESDLMLKVVAAVKLSYAVAVKP